MDTPASSGIAGAIVRRLLVVAMAMERLQVCGGAASRQDDGLHMVDFHEIVKREQQATVGAPSTLAGKEPPEGRSCLRVQLASLSPVGVVAVKRGGRAAHLNRRCHVNLPQKVVDQQAYRWEAVLPAVTAGR